MALLGVCARLEAYRFLGLLNWCCCAAWGSLPLSSRFVWNPLAERAVGRAELEQVDTTATASTLPWLERLGDDAAEFDAELVADAIEQLCAEYGLEGIGMDLVSDASPHLEPTTDGLDKSRARDMDTGVDDDKGDADSTVAIEDSDVGTPAVSPQRERREAGIVRLPPQVQQLVWAAL